MNKIVLELFSGTGSVGKVCRNYGFEYNDIPSLLKGIEKIKAEYKEYRNKIDYEFLDSKRCYEEYNNIILKMFGLS